MIFIRKALVLALVVLAGMSAQADSAVEDGDSIRAIPDGTQLTLTRDLLIKARQSLVYFGGAGECYFMVSSSSQARRIKSGGSVKVKGGNDAVGYAFQFDLDGKTLLWLRCDNRLTVGDFKTLFAGTLSAKFPESTPVDPAPAN